jgi:hypothetical protein
VDSRASPPSLKGRAGSPHCTTSGPPFGPAPQDSTASAPYRTPALASYTQPLRVTPSPASCTRPCELHPALRVTPSPCELHPALRVAPSPASYTQPCELHPALWPQPGFGRGFHYRPSSAARPPPPKHGPAPRRTRPSAESAPLSQPLYCLSTRPHVAAVPSTPAAISAKPPAVARPTGV